MIALFFAAALAASVELPEGRYGGHLQDVWWDGGTNVYWAHTETVLRTDATGKVLATVSNLYHNAGCALKDGRLYVACCPSRGKGRAATTPESRVVVCEYDAVTLALVKEHVLDLRDRAGSLCVLPDGTFLVGCLRPPEIGRREVRLHHLDRDFRLKKTHVIDVGKEIKLGIEVIKLHGDDVYLLCGGARVKLDAKTLEVKSRSPKTLGHIGTAFVGDRVLIGRCEQPEKGLYRSSLRSMDFSAFDF